MLTIQERVFATMLFGIASTTACFMQQTARADDDSVSSVSDPIGCGSTSQLPDSIWDITPQVEFNRYGHVGQQIGEVSAVEQNCISLLGSSKKNARLHFEGTISAVDEEGRKAYSGLLGVGLLFRIAANWTVTPVLRVGYEHFESGTANIVYDAFAQFAGEYEVATAADGRHSYLVLDLTPEFSQRESASATLPSNGGLNSTFLGEVQGGFDFPVGNDDLRMKVAGDYQHASARGGADPASLVISMRRESSGWYDRDYGIWLRTGARGYRAVLLTIDFRFGG
jgi:hypothetical protein